MLNYLDIEFRDDERLIQQTVREFVEREALTLVRPCFEAGRFPSELIPRLAELGLLGATLPEYGAGIGPVAYGLICQELERADRRPAQFRLRAKFAVHAPHLPLRLRRTAPALPAGDGRGRSDWLLRPDRGRLRLRSRLMDPRGA